MYYRNFMSFRRWYSLLRDAVQAFQADKAPRLAAALSYYAIFSIAPMLFFVLAVGNSFLASENIREQLFRFLTENLNEDAVKFVQSMIPSGESLKQSSLLASGVGFVVLFMGATGLFTQLKTMLNEIWKVPDEQVQGIKPMLLGRVQAFGLILAFGIVIIVFLAANTYFSAIAEQLGEWLGLGHLGIWLVRLTTLSLGVVLLTFMFAAIYAILPNVHLNWRQTLAGGFVTAVLFNIGQIAIGYYLAKFSPVSTFGAASSLVVLLLWINFSSMVFFFGAEITWVYTQNHAEQKRAEQKNSEDPDDVDGHTEK